MSQIGIAYTDQASNSYQVLFSLFSGTEVARTYDASVSFERGVSGTQLVQGRPGRQKYIWAVSALLPNAQAKELDDMFKAWDADRATGLSVALGVTDETLFDTVTTSAIVSTPPSYAQSGPHHLTVAFGLTEV